MEAFGKLGKLNLAVCRTPHGPEQGGAISAIALCIVMPIESASRPSIGPLCASADRSPPLLGRARVLFTRRGDLCHRPRMGRQWEVLRTCSLANYALRRFGDRRSLGARAQPPNTPPSPLPGFPSAGERLFHLALASLGTAALASGFDGLDHVELMLEDDRMQQ